MLSWIDSLHDLILATAYTRGYILHMSQVILSTESSEYFESLISQNVKRCIIVHRIFGLVSKLVFGPLPQLQTERLFRMINRR